MSKIKTFVFLDLETTGLPHLEHNLTKITEFCAVSVQAGHIELGCFPRVNNKLSLCFNPNKLISPESTDITGLSNELLEYQSSFTFDVVETIKNWLCLHSNPICFVAHNGNRFDYPILRAEIERARNFLDESVLCIDSLPAFRELDQTVDVQNEQVPFEFDDGFDEILLQAADEYEKKKLSPEEVQRVNETTPKKQMIGSQTRNGCVRNVKKTLHPKKQFTSYKLQDIYTRLTKRESLKAHEAEGDVDMLITCAASYGEKFVAYANQKAVKFSEIPVMKPGRKIGT